VTSKNPKKKPQTQFKQEDHSLTLVNARGAARHISVSRYTLRYWRAHDIGPPCVRVSKRLIRYDLAALRAWVKGHGGERWPVSLRARQLLELR
jgi:hypothetical protein